MVQENYMCSWTDHSNYFFNSISSLRLNEILTDVTITCGDKYFQAHKLVLCASSDYFRSILANNIEKLAIVHIVGVPPVYIHNILQYLYTGQIEITPSDVEPFLRVANDLKICGLYKDDSYLPISEPEPESMEPEPVSVPAFIPSMDPTLRTRFKNPVPIDELRIKKRVRGSEATLGNSVPEESRSPGGIAIDLTESSGSSSSSHMDQRGLLIPGGPGFPTIKLPPRSSTSSPPDDLAATPPPPHQAPPASSSDNKEEEITIVPDIVDLNENSKGGIEEEDQRDNKENVAAGSRGVSPRPLALGDTSGLSTLARSSPAGLVMTTNSSTPILSSGIDLRSSGGAATKTEEEEENVPKITLRWNSSELSAAVEPSTPDDASSTPTTVSAAAIGTRSSTGSMNKRKSIPTKLDTSEKRTRLIEDDNTPTVAAMPPISLSPALITSESSPSSPVSTPLSSLTTRSLNSPYLRSGSNPCKGLVPLNCRKGHSGHHCNHMIIPLPDGRKAHYSKQEYEQWLKSN